ncbi:dipeptidase [Oceanobacillus sojae]|uniref:dipeptidase n=1 Tax=Oceanobacillus sojae TaxID=582851 RepID=UPI0021A7FC51|nr:dipeptidase [Oceanobacillus sojae]MCT1902202.1 dipeptidase [Oceanobacillus sojae]
MKVIDTHCDALLKLQTARLEQRKLDFRNAPEIETNLKRLEAGNVSVQFFAIFVNPETVTTTDQWKHAEEQATLFHEEIVEKNENVKFIRDWKDIRTLASGEIGAVLTLEGAEAIGNDMEKLQKLYQMGVKSFGLTWNPANLCADGAGEPRGAGLTTLGKEVVRLNNENKVLTDVSHLSVKAFWDVMELADYPIASHSNTRAICDHPRNLYDDQLKALIAKNAPIHFALYPVFLKKNARTATVADLCEHIDHVCALGGEKNIGFGSDFDGISCYIDNITNSSGYDYLLNELQKHYSEEQVRGFAYQNFMNMLP